MILRYFYLIDSYAFSEHALAKFPAIFNTAEEKKDCFPSYFLTDLSFGITSVLSLIGDIMSLILFFQENVKNFKS